MTVIVKNTKGHTCNILNLRWKKVFCGQQYGAITNGPLKGTPII
jgi:hypothetical protein